MRVDDEVGEVAVCRFVSVVLQDQNQVESADNGLRQVHVVLETQRAVVAAPNRVGGSYDTAPGLQLRHDARLADADGLLFHGFVDAGSVDLVHFVEFVNAADAVVGEHERPPFQSPFSSDRVFVASCGQPD